MIAGRSGTQKSGLALFWVDEMSLPTLYFSADMSAFTASTRLASKRSRLTTPEVEAIMLSQGSERREMLQDLAGSNITFSFGSPITWRQIDEELEAYVELWNTYPSVIVLDNLMDFEGAEADYQAQMGVMQSVTEIARDTGATVIVLHHASDKGWSATTDPWQPPARSDIKNGLGEKPELCLTVALDPHTNEYRIAIVKQRMGACDPTARSYARILCEPQYTSFKPLGV